MADNKSFAGTEVDHGSVQKDKNSVSAGVGAEAGAEASSKRGPNSQVPPVKLKGGGCAFRGTKFKGVF